MFITFSRIKKFLLRNRGYPQNELEYFFIKKTVGLLIKKSRVPSPERSYFLSSAVTVPTVEDENEHHMKHEMETRLMRRCKDYVM